MYPSKYLLITLFTSVFPTLRAEVSDTDLNDLSERQNSIKINKCCELDEVVEDGKCRPVSYVNTSEWVPKFSSDDGKPIKVKYYNRIIGIPDCQKTQQRGVLSLRETEDKLMLLSDGRLRHYIYHEHEEQDNLILNEDPIHIGPFSINEPIHIPEEKEPIFHDYVQGKYCMDKIVFRNNNETGLYALVCIPLVNISWTEPDFLMKKIFNPIFHGLAMIIFLIVAIVYFILPTLRDLAGNIITTINICLIVSQAADVVRIFTELSNHVSFMIADVVLYISLLGAFFWLNSYGFYVWKAFKSRNVFLRMTNMRKYCYYSCAVWGTIGFMTALAICAHYFLDSGPVKVKVKNSSFMIDAQQETIGWLGIAIFFTPIAFTIIFNIFFCVTTMNVIKRLKTYGRIHHKLKGSFHLFIQLFIIMTFAWLFLLLSWLQYDGLVYAHVVVNLLQAVLVLYVCVARQPHVAHMLRKSCCYAEPVPAGEWGDEMTHMNGDYDGVNYTPAWNEPPQPTPGTAFIPHKRLETRI